MTFLNFALLFGTAAASVPVLIHLLNRSRYKVVSWGAMHLLESVVQINRRRIRIEQLIMLLIRMGIIGILALCMAAPVLTRFTSLVGDAKTSLAVVLDNSFSMDAGLDGGSHLEQARDELIQIVKSHRRGTDLSLRLMAGGTISGSKSATTDLDAAANELSLIEEGFGQARPSQSIEASIRELSRMQNAKRDLIIVSDFQSSDWLDEESTSFSRLSKLIDQMPIKPSITLMPINSEKIDNVSVTSTELSPSIVSVGRKQHIRATVRNHGDVPYTRMLVKLRVDEKDISTERIDLLPHADQQVSFTYTFETVGSHVIETSVDADPLHVDNKQLVAVSVWNQVPVLMVNGSVSSEPLGNETAFLEIALAPFVPTNSDSSSEVVDTDLIQVRTILPRELDSECVAGASVIVLANVESVTDAQLDMLASHIREGRSLLIFPGNQCNVSWYNKRLYDNGAGLLPSTWIELKTSETELVPVSFKHGTDDLPLSSNGISNDDGMTILQEHWTHPALSQFNDSRNGALSDARVQSWYSYNEDTLNRVPTIHATDSDPPGEVVPQLSQSILARLSNGNPLFVERKYGQGRVIACATSCDDDWNNLPLRPFFVPMMQHLVSYLASSVEPPVNIPAGQPLVTRISNSLDHAALTIPSGEQIELDVTQVDDEGNLEYTETERPGLYTLALGSEMRHIVVQNAARESDLAVLSSEQLEDVARQFDASIVANAYEYFELDSQRRYGREIWKPLFLLLLILFFAEMMLRQFFARRRL